MNTELKLKVTEIQRFCMHDGPGIRTTVFLKGCPLRCAWCHNPETQSRNSELLLDWRRCIGCGGCADACPHGAHVFCGGHSVDRSKCAVCGACAEICPAGALETCGTDLTAREILSVVERDRAFYGENGGITLSGGEPLSQGRAVIALLEACRECGLHTAVETCGYVDAEILREAIPLVDLFLWDVKDTNDERHLTYTGVSNRKILDNLALADALGAKARLRSILVSGVNTDDAHYREVARIALSLSRCEGVELIPYHAYAGSKAVLLGREDNGRKEWIPDSKQIDRAKSVMEGMGAIVL